MIEKVKLSRVMPQIEELMKEESFLKNRYIRYSGKSLNDFAIVTMATFYSGKTLIIGENISDVNYPNILDIESVGNFQQINSYDSKTFSMPLGDEIALATSTSGSTSTPKVVEFTRNSIINRVNYIQRDYQLSNATTELIVLPITSTAIFLDQFLPTLLAGGEITRISLPFNPVEIINELGKYYEYTGLTPTVLQLLTRFGIDWSSVKVKHIAVGGERIDFDLITRVSDRLTQSKIFPMYGLTETGAAVTGWPDDDNQIEKRSVGKPLDGVEIIVNENAEILIKSEGNARNYNVNGTREVIARESWIYTGDIGHIDNEGYLYVDGRIKNLIIVGGVNVYPEEVQNIINSHPGVLANVVYGSVSEQFGEEVYVDVVLDSAYKDKFTDIKNILIRQLGKYKAPKKWFVVDKIELTGLGKATAHDKL